MKILSVIAGVFFAALMYLGYNTYREQSGTTRRRSTCTIPLMVVPLMTIVVLAIHMNFV
jgi:hypothetical protein